MEVLSGKKLKMGSHDYIYAHKGKYYYPDCVDGPTPKMRAIRPTA